MTKTSLNLLQVTKIPVDFLRYRPLAPAQQVHNLCSGRLVAFSNLSRYEVQAYLAALLTGEIRQTAGRPASNVNSDARLIWEFGRWYRGYLGRGVSDPVRRTILKLAERQGKTFETMEREYRRSKARLREWRHSRKFDRWDGENLPLIIQALTEIDRNFRHLK